MLMLCVGMAITALIGAALNEVAAATTFVIVALGLGFVSLLNTLSFPRTKQSLTIQGATFYTLSVSLLIPLISAIPFVAIDPSISFGDALFESVSAITTTGFSIFDSFAGVSRTLIVWRSMLQWIGGFLIMTTMAAIVVQLTLRELPIVSSHSQMREEYTLYERIMITAQVLAPVYLVLTAICFVILSVAGVSIFNAFCLALSTVSTGGFLPDAVGNLDRDAFRIDVILFPFMILGATNFMIHLRAASGQASIYFTDRETQVFMMILVGAAVFLTAASFDSFAGLFGVFFQDLFAVASLLTTTGYAFGTEQVFREMPLPVALALMLVGGSLISTAGGIKVMRLIVLASHSFTELSRLTHPSGIILLKSGNVTIESGTVSGIWITFVLTLSTIALACFGLSASGIDFERALVLAIGALSNCGAITPYLIDDPVAIAEQSGLFKVVLAAAMIVGRIEILFLLPLFDRYFWAN